uniref:Homing endonuclease LAGLIDADG domain-containing protein n=1 Tax=Naumovozyma dairenensis TaxID=27289 RepID=A0A2D0W3S9_9SACH|nr:hypothetical protein [Naumovozyma dairenensis]APD15103.1 hypothetical protein [Naumovozyma dairenensis]
METNDLIIDTSIMNNENMFKKFTVRMTIQCHWDEQLYLDMVNKIYNGLDSKLIFKKISNDSKYHNIMTCTVSIHKFTVLEHIFMPMFKNKPILGKKYNDMILWLNALELVMDNNTSTDNIKKAIDLKNQMNTKSTFNDLSLTTEFYNKMLNLQYIIGFFEAEGTFSIRYMMNTHSFGISMNITQKRGSNLLMKSMLEYLYNLPIDSNCKIKLDNTIPKMIDRADKNQVMIQITNLDRMYYSVMPALAKEKFYTRKQIDFVMFMIGIIMLKHGLHYIPEGWKLYHTLRENMNKYRYYTNNVGLPTLKDIMDILTLKPLHDTTKNNRQNTSKYKRVYFDINKNMKIYTPIKLK